MTRTDHLLVILMEECDEVSQRVAKALRFGLDEVQLNHQLTNAQRIADELTDLFATVDMLQRAAILPSNIGHPNGIAKKQMKIEKYLGYSKEQGRLTENE